jgi:hypothetical protein
MLVVVFALDTAGTPVRAGLGTIHVPASHIPSWRQRPHGSLSGKDLGAQAQRAEYTAARQMILADRARAETDRIRAAADAGNGPRTRALVEQRERLRARVVAGDQAQAAADQAHTARGRVEAAYARSRQAWDRIAALEAQRQRNPLVLRLSGTSRQNIAAEQAQLRQVAQRAVIEAEAHGRRVAELEHAARGVRDGQVARRELERLTETWPTQIETARRVDARGADDQDQRAARHAASAAEWGQRVRTLRTEETVRDGLPPLRVQTEDLARSTAALSKAVERMTADRNDSTREAAREDAEREARWRGYDHGPDRGRDGPSLGM